MKGITIRNLTLAEIDGVSCDIAGGSPGGALVDGFFSEAGKDFYNWSKEKIQDFFRPGGDGSLIPANVAAEILASRQLYIDRNGMCMPLPTGPPPGEDGDFEE